MQPGRKVVMLATNAFGLGIDKPDIRYIIHYQMPGSPESYVQEAGRAGRDGKPARCVLLFQPDDIAIQEHFLKEAHPTKAQARMVAEGLYAWSDEGKEVSVRDLALSMALPERRVRVILSVLEAMGVAKEVKAARWEGVEPKPTREQIDKAASVFEARRISDRRRLASLLAYMNTQNCRVQMMRLYFGEPEGPRCGLCDSCAGLDSEVFDPGSADVRHGLHAATDFHARPRRRRRGRGGEVRVDRIEAPGMGGGGRPAAPAVVFQTAIPSDVPPPLAPVVVEPPAENEATFDAAVWTETPGAGEALAGDAVFELDPSWQTPEVAADTVDLGVEALAPANGEQAAAATTSTFESEWSAVRDANIRPYVEWRPTAAVTLPVFSGSGAGGVGGGGGGNRPQHQFQKHGHKGHGQGRGPNGNDGGGGGGGRHRRRRRGGGDGGGNRHTRGYGREDRNRDRGPRLPGFYNPGGD